MKKILFLMFFVSTISFSCFCQNPEWIIYNTDNSELPHNNILSIAEENTIKWIGTGDNFESGGTFGGGLTKFDNSSWVTYHNQTSYIPDNEYKIWAIEIDEQSRKWIGTNEFYPNDEGLTVFDDVNWMNYNTGNSGIPDYIVTDILIDEAGNKWLATINSGLVKYDGINWTIYNTANSLLPDNHTTSIAIDNDGEYVWVGTTNGLVKFNGTDWTLFNTGNSGLPDNCINAIAFDYLNIAWIGTNNGLVKYSNDDWDVFNTENSELPDNKVNCISTEPWIYTWVGTDYGLARFPGSSSILYETTNSDLPSNQINTIFVDQFENKWIGTDSGLAVFREEGVDLPVEACPDAYLYRIIGTIDVPAHISQYNNEFSCWGSLTEIYTVAQPPLGVDMAIVITELNGPPESIIEYSTNQNISLGDTLYLIQDGVNNHITFLHLNYSGLTFKYLIKGTPSEYNQMYDCSYKIRNLGYTECSNYGFMIDGVGTCFTCDNPTNTDEIFEKSKTSVFPNPNNGNMSVDYNIPKGSSGALVFYDANGRKITSYKLDANSNQIYLTNENLFSEGMYHFSLIIDGKLVSKEKLVIIK